MSSNRLHIDYETFVGSVDIRDVGAYRYANSHDCEILCCAMALGNEEPVVWTAANPDIPDRYWDALEDPSVLIYAFHAAFEMAISQALMWKTWGVRCPDLKRFRCVQSLARRAALPAKLETLGEVLNLSNQKDKKGKSLIKKFSVLQPARKPSKAHPNGVPPRRIYPRDKPELFREFCEYCRGDVKAERESAHKLAYFDEPINNANYNLDAIINARGVTVNLQALRHAQKLIEEETEIVSEKFRKLTGFEVTQNAKLLEWLNSPISRVPKFENLQAETIDTFLDGWTGEEFEEVQALRLKQSIAYASIKKVATMLACAGPHDNRLRGMIEYHVATTGRWGGRLVQVQNFKRSTIEHSKAAYQEICEGISREMLELCYGPVLEVISSCIRHFIQDSNE